MAEAHVTHVVAMVRKVGELADAHDAEHRTAVVMIHRDTLAGLAARAEREAHDPVPASLPTTPRTGRR